MTHEQYEQYEKFRAMCGGADPATCLPIDHFGSLERGILTLGLLAISGVLLWCILKLHKRLSDNPPTSNRSNGNLE